MLGFRLKEHSLPLEGSAMLPGVDDDAHVYCNVYMLNDNKEN